MTQGIRLWSPGDEGGVEVCDHVELPTAKENNDACEYVLSLSIRCEECDETYSFNVLVN